MMPFRVPDNYTTLSVSGQDPSQTSVWNYVVWLRRELAVAEAALAQLDSPTNKNAKPKEEKA